MGRPSKYAPELRERAVRMVLEHAGEHASQWAAIRSVAEKLGCTTEALRRWVRQAERDHGQPAWPDDRRTAAAEGPAAGERRVEAGQRDSAQGVRVFCPGGARPPREVMVGFIDDHRDQYGVEPICAVLPIAPSTYFRTRRSRPIRRAARRARSATTSCASRFSACGMPTSRSTARGRCGGSCAASRSASRTARSGG